MGKMLEENSRLQAVNTQLQIDNAALQQENSDLKSRLGMEPATTTNTDITMHLELPPSPVSLPPTSPLPGLVSPAPGSPSTTVTTLSPPESAAGSGQQCVTQHPRVVVERLDSLGGG